MYIGNFSSSLDVCFDEETRALWTNEIRLNMKVIGAEARARLAVELSRMGYGVIEDKQKSITSFHLQGVSPEDRAHFSKRANQVRQRMEAGDFGKSSVATLATREGKGDWTRSDFLKAWSAEFAARGLSETAIRARQPKAPRRERSDQGIIDGLLEMQAHFSARDALHGKRAIDTALVAGGVTCCEKMKRSGQSARRPRRQGSSAS